MQDLTKGSPVRLILTFAVPMLLGGLFQQTYVLIDAAVVGMVLGVESLAAVGGSQSVVFLLMGISMGSSAGFAIPVAKAFGAGDMSEVRKTAAAGLLLTIGVAALITVAGVVGGPLLLNVMNTPPEIIEEATLFVRALFAGASTTVLFNYQVATVRALGDSRTPLYLLIGSSIFNALLALLFVGGFGWGVAGAALATLTAHGIAAAVFQVIIWRRLPILRLSRADFAAGSSHLLEPFRLGLPMGLQWSVIAIGSMSVQMAINDLGPLSVAAFTAAMRVDSFGTLPMSAFSTALVTYVAQNRGARQWQRIRQGVWRTVLVGVGISVVAGLIIVMIGSSIVSILTGGDGEVIAMSRQVFLTNSTLHWVLAIVFITRAAVQGMGVASAPFISCVGETLGRIAVALLLVPQIGFLGVALAAPIAWLVGYFPLGLSWFRQRAKIISLEQDTETPLPLIA